MKIKTKGKNVQDNLKNHTSIQCSKLNDCLFSFATDKISCQNHTNFNKLLVPQYVSEIVQIRYLYFIVGIPNNELVIGESPSKVSMTASITTAKTTLGQSATITARDAAYQVRECTQLRNTLEFFSQQKRTIIQE